MRNIRSMFGTLTDDDDKRIVDQIKLAVIDALTAASGAGSIVVVGKLEIRVNIAQGGGARIIEGDDNTKENRA